MSEGFKTIMIVDDSGIERRILKNILNKNYKIIEAGNGYAALDNILEKRMLIDLILLDISMPVLKGFDVIDILEKNNVTIPVILITAEATFENVVNAKKRNVKDFISKPFNAEVIQKRVAAVTDKIEK